MMAPYSSQKRYFAPRRQRGVALWTVVVLALLLGLLALSQSNSVLSQFRGARNERDLALARQAAEAALRDAEADVTCQTWVGGALVSTASAANPRVNSYCTGIAANGVGCGDARYAQNSPGVRLLERVPTTAPAAIDWNPSTPCDHSNCAVVLGTKTGAEALDSEIFKRQPRYHIDIFDTNDLTPEVKPVFRITARGYGRTEATVVDVQEVYRPCQP